MTNSPLNRRQLLKLSATSAAVGLLPSAMLTAPSLAAGFFGHSGLPGDSRLGNLKDLDGYFPFAPPATAAAWEKRKEFVKRQILVACGLWPMPERPPIQATVHGRVEREDYTVDRVYFESSPGLLVTGSLYLPKNAAGKLPTVLCPHGHWANGRFHDHGADQLKRELASGGEVSEVGGRHPLQARCVQLARMGCMVFLYDMLGYADGSSLTQQLAHGFAKQRPHLSSPEKWGLFSAQSELRCVNALGLQTWNSVRTLDWIMSRPDCDTSRIGVTGASGGGTQTFLLAAIDDRVTAAFPAVMVSTAMQGGCTCENASYLRVNTGNIEFAAMSAPRPISMTGADDWTVEIETKGLPELKKHFAMLGVPDNVQAKYFKFPHNYNLPSRMMMYEFFNRTLNLGVKEIAERDYVPLTQAEATVFDSQHAAPAKNEETEVALLQAFDAASQKQLSGLVPSDAASLKEFRRVYGGALDVMIGRSLPEAGSTVFETLSEDEKDGFKQYTGKLKLTSHGEELPTVFLLPSSWNRKVVVWIDGGGKKGIFESDGKLTMAVAQLVRAGYAIGSADLYLTGEFTDDGNPVSQMPVVKNPREFVGFTLGYNHPLFSQRVHDVLTLTSSTVYHEQAPDQVHLVGVNGAGAIVAAAGAIAGGKVSSVAVDTAGFRFATITDYRDVNLLPGAVKYGDVPAMLALCAPVKLAVAGESADTVPLATAAYRAASARLSFQEDSSDSSIAIAKWIQSNS
jgi:dienelactone hydrolase